jgi:hypothetical protein
LEIALAKKLDLRAERGEAFLAGGILACGEVITQPEEDHGESDRDGDDSGNGATCGHTYSKFGS